MTGDLDGFFEKARQTHKKLTDAGLDKIQESLDRTMAEMPDLRAVLVRAGYAIEKVVLSISITPGVVATIARIGEGSSTLAAVAEEPGLTRTQRLVVGALRRAESLGRSAERYQFQLDRFDIEISINPKVDVHLTWTGALPPMLEE